MASLDKEEESLSDEIEDNEPEPHVNHNVQVIHDVQDGRNIKIYNMEGKEEKLQLLVKMCQNQERKGSQKVWMIIFYLSF